MTKAELKKIASDNTILECEVENAIEFVRDLLEFYAKEIEENEPYATRIIDRLWRAARDVDDLIEYVSECEEC